MTNVRNEHHADQDERIFREALAPRRRYKAIALGEAKWGQEGDTGLFFEDANGNGTVIVNLRPGDLPALRALFLPQSRSLEELKDIWSAKAGPGGGHAVEAGHAAGYRLGVSDMERAYCTDEEVTVPRQALEYLLGHLADELAGTPDRSHWRLAGVRQAAEVLSQAVRNG